MKRKTQNTKHKKNNFLSNLLIVLVALLVFFQLNLTSQAETLKFAQFSDSHISDRTTNSSYIYLTLSKDILKDARERRNMPGACRELAGELVGSRKTAQVTCVRACEN